MAELAKPSYNIIIQECIEDSLGRDLRVLVVNGKVVGCMMRQSVDGDFRANITRGGEAIPYQIDEDIEWISGESARLLDLDINDISLSSAFIPVHSRLLSLDSSISPKESEII